MDIAANEVLVEVPILPITITIADSNGNINRIVTCSENLVSLQVATGEIWVPGSYNSDTHFINPITLKIENCISDKFKQFSKESGSWVYKQGAFQIASREVRDLRDSLLKETDWTQLADVVLPTYNKEAWLIYRQALRDISLQLGYPFNISWPTKPG